MVLSRAISDLRKVFGDSARKQSYIETVTKQGYRLKKAVSWQEDETTQNSPQETNDSDITEESAKLGVEQTIELEENSVPESFDDKSPLKYKILTIFGVVLLLYLLISWLFSTNNSEDKIEAPYQAELRKITSNNDKEYHVRISSGGKYLAYSSASENTNNRKIRLHSLVNNEIIQIGGLAGSEAEYFGVAPTFSPDGKYVAYKRISDEGCTIQIYNLLDKRQRELLECPFSRTSALDWSNDGKSLLTTMFNPIKKVESLALIEVNSGVLKPLKDQQTKASGYLWPRFSSDDKKIAVVYVKPADNTWTIGTFDIAKNKFVKVLTLGEEVSQVVWNKNDDSLYYLLVNSTNNGIWQVNLKSKQTKLITDISSSSLDFDPVSKQFVYIERDAKFNIWKTHKNALGQLTTKRLVENLPQTNYPSLSPNNKHLAFVSTESGMDSLWFRELEYNFNVLLFQGDSKEKLLEPSWSPDGNKVLATVMQGNTSKLMQFDVELAEVKQIQSKNNTKMGKWSEDGSMMYWYEQIEGTWHVIEKDIANNQQRIILSQAIDRFEIVDKNNLHYQKIGTIHVHSLALDKQSTVEPEKKILFSLQGFHGWDAHNKEVYYISRSLTGKHKALFKKNISNDTVEEMYAIDVKQTDKTRTLSVSNDGNTSFYTRQDKYVTDIVLMNVK